MCCGARDHLLPCQVDGCTDLKPSKIADSLLTVIESSNESQGQLPVGDAPHHRSSTTGDHDRSMSALAQMITIHTGVACSYPMSESEWPERHTPKCRTTSRASVPNRCYFKAVHPMLLLTEYSRKTRKDLVISRPPVAQLIQHRSPKNSVGNKFTETRLRPIINNKRTIKQSFEYNHIDSFCSWLSSRVVIIVSAC